MNARQQADLRKRWWNQTIYDIIGFTVRLQRDDGQELRFQTLAPTAMEAIERAREHVKRHKRRPYTVVSIASNIGIQLPEDWG